MEAYKKELEEYKNSIAVATDDNLQLQNELVAEEEEHTTNNTIAGAEDAKPKKNKSKHVKDCWICLMIWKCSCSPTSSVRVVVVVVSSKRQVIGLMALSCVIDLLLQLMEILWFRI